MPYIEAGGKDPAVVEKIVDEVLAHEDTVTMMVVGSDHEQVAMDARDVAANNSPSTWWVVWIRNPRLLSEERQEEWRVGPAGDPDGGTAAIVLSRRDEVARRLSPEEADYKDQLLYAFWDAEEAG